MTNRLNSALGPAWGPVVVVDTSTATLNVAVIQGGCELIQHVLPHESHRWHSARLIPALADVLLQSAVDLSQIQAVACATGPGSFTGLRTGLTCAKTLAYALNIPVIAISTVDWWVWAGMQQGWLSAGQQVAVLLNALRGRVYAALACVPEALNQRPVLLQPMQCLPLADGLGPHAVDVVLAEGSLMQPSTPNMHGVFSATLHAFPRAEDCPDISMAAVLHGVLSGMGAPLALGHPLTAPWQSLMADYVQPPSITLPNTQKTPA